MRFYNATRRPLKPAADCGIGTVRAQNRYRYK